MNMDPQTACSISLFLLFFLSESRSRDKIAYLEGQDSLFWLQVPVLRIQWIKSMDIGIVLEDSAPVDPRCFW